MSAGCGRFIRVRAKVSWMPFGPVGGLANFQREGILEFFGRDELGTDLTSVNYK